METNRLNGLLFLAFLLVGLAYAFIGIIAAHPFDDAIYAFNSQMFYDLHGSPFLYLPQGIFLDAINIAGYFPIALLTLFLKSNVLFIQLGVKIPFILIGLSSGSHWYVQIDGTNYSSVSSFMTLYLPNATYNYRVVLPYGYSGKGIAGTIGYYNNVVIVSASNLLLTYIVIIVLVVFLDLLLVFYILRRRARKAAKQ